MKNTLAMFYIPCASRSEAQMIARHLLGERLIACANIAPQVESLYLWEGQITETEEAVLILKTVSHLGSQLVARIKELHSYSAPCLIEIEPRSVNKDYADWIINSLPAAPQNETIKPKAQPSDELAPSQTEDDDRPPWD